MSREWDRAARDRLTSTLSLGSRWRVRTELTAAIRAVSRVVDAAALCVRGRAEASGAATATNRTTVRTDSAPRNIRSAVFYQAGRTETRPKCHENEQKVRFEREKLVLTRVGPQTISGSASERRAFGPPG